jgi:hypothetical protein
VAADVKQQAFKTSTNDNKTEGKLGKVKEDCHLKMIT